MRKLGRTSLEQKLEMPGWCNGKYKIGSVRLLVYTLLPHTSIQKKLLLGSVKLWVLALGSEGFRAQSRHKIIGSSDARLSELPSDS